MENAAPAIQLNDFANTQLFVERDPSIYPVVSRINLLDTYCTPSQKSFLSESLVCCKYKKNDLIFKASQHESGIYAVISGTVALWKEKIHSKRQYFRFMQEGDLFGYRGSILEHSSYLLSASAFEDAKICYIRTEDFKSVLQENRELHVKIMLNYVKELEKIENSFYLYSMMDSREKLAEALLTIIGILKHKGKNTEFSKFISRKEIADIAGISMGRTINLLAEFLNEKIIIKQGKRIIRLDVDKLKMIVSKYHE